MLIENIISYENFKIESYLSTNFIRHNLQINCMFSHVIPQGNLYKNIILCIERYVRME